MKKDSKNKLVENEEAISYPRLDLERALPILKKVVEAGDIVLRSDLAKICGVNKKGGGFNHILAALKLYGVINKEGQSDFRISELGKEVIKEDKNSVLQAMVKVPVFNDLFHRYNGAIPKKVIVKGYVSSKYGIEPNTANTIASRFIKNMRFLNKLSGDASLPKELPKPDKQTIDMNFVTTYKTLVDVNAGIKTGDIKTVNDALEKLKDIKLPLLSGNEIISNLSNTQVESEEDKKAVMKMILEMIIQTYSK